jgi:hypothetical protein
VRLASRDELAAAARVAPLLRAARDLARWAVRRQAQPKAGLSAAAAASAAEELDLSQEEIAAAWQVAASARMLDGTPPGDQPDILAAGDPDTVLTLWNDALCVMLRTEELEGLVTALYTVGGPVRIDALFEAYETARVQAPPVDAGESGPAQAGPVQAGPGQAGPGQAGPGQAGPGQAGPGQAGPGQAGPGQAGPGQAGPGQAGAGETDVLALSAALETLADLGVVDLGSDEEAGVLTVALSRLGTWGVHGRLRARGWQLPVAGQLAQHPAAVLLAALADYDAEEGEAEIAAWLGLRGPAEAAAELMEAARQGSPGLRGAAFAVLDRVGDGAIPAVREALDDPVLRPHAVVWLRDHGDQAELARGDQEWLLVDLGAGLLEEAEPEDVVAELLPDLPSGGQSKLVADLWRVSHPGLIGLLTALGAHHHDPAVAKAARKAAFKARSHAAMAGVGERPPAGCARPPAID